MAVPTSRTEFKEFCLRNKYTKWYFNIIENCINRNWDKKNAPCYVEAHHILPKSIYKNNNIVYLTAKEHFLCHLLLVKMVEGENKSKMAFALHRLICGNNKNYNITSILYEKIKKENSFYSSIRSKKWWKKFTKLEKSEMRKGDKNGRFNKKISLETKQKISKANKGRLSKEKHPFWNKIRSNETKSKISKARKNKCLGENNPNYKKGASKGKKWFHDPINKVEKYFIDGQQPINFVKGRI